MYFRLNAVKQVECLKWPRFDTGKKNTGRWWKKLVIKQFVYVTRLLFVHKLKKQYNL